MVFPLSIPGTDALVVFVNHTECRWLTWLRPGFRHCFAALRMDHRWVVCDSLKNSMELCILAPPRDFDLASFYVEKGHVVIAGTRMRQPDDYRLAIEPLTCVAVTKRMIGFRSVRVQTPWQLFRALVNVQAQSVNWQLCSRPGNAKVATKAGLTIP